MKIQNKGQVGAGVSESILGLLVIVAIAYVTIKVGNSMGTNTLTGDVSSSTEARMSHGNFTDNLWDSYQLMSLTPYLIGALVVITLVIGFAKLIGVGKL